MNEPRLIGGGIHVDDRGETVFVNAFDFRDVKRFYTIANHRSGTVRAWHGHKREAKYVSAVRGAFLVCCVKIDDWEGPSKELHIHRFVLAEHSPAVLYIPAGHANGLMSLADDAKAIVFSTATLQESATDDFRFPARMWDAWSIEER